MKRKRDLDFKEDAAWLTFCPLNNRINEMRLNPCSWPIDVKVECLFSDTHFYSFVEKGVPGVLVRFKGLELCMKECGKWIFRSEPSTCVQMQGPCGRCQLFASESSLRKRQALHVHKKVHEEKQFLLSVN